MQPYLNFGNLLILGGLILDVVFVAMQQMDWKLGLMVGLVGLGAIIKN